MLLVLDMAAERKRLRSRKDSVVTGADTEDEFVEVGREDVQGQGANGVESGEGKEGVRKEDLSELALLSRTVSSAWWSGVEGVRKGVWGLAGWA